MNFKFALIIACCFYEVSSYLSTIRHFFFSSSSTVGRVKSISSSLLASTTEVVNNINRDDVLQQQKQSEDSSTPSKKLPYDWKKQWYAVTFECNIPKVGEKKPLSYSIFDRELVFWRDESGRVLRTEDKCPHRGARLSEGQVDKGKIECLYHGWKYEGNAGSCTFIPQLPIGAVIPTKACLKTYATAFKEGILWVWMDDVPSTADYNKIPMTQVDLDDIKNKKAFTIYDFQIDLPYDNSYLVENLLDPAHIPVSHDRTQGGGLKENAQPYQMVVQDFTSTGFTSTATPTRPNVAKPSFLSSLQSKFFSRNPSSDNNDNHSNKTYKKQSPPLLSQSISFEAPGIVRYHTARGNFIFGAALHCMPVCRGKSRLLFRTFFKAPWIMKWMFSWKPLFLRHLNSCKVLEQDVGLITSQEDLLDKRNRYTHLHPNTNDKLSTVSASSATTATTLQQVNPADDWLTLSSSDAILVQYRKWLDAVGHGMPYYQGWRTRSQSASGDSSGSGTAESSVDAYASDSMVHTSDKVHHRKYTSRYYNHVIHHKPTLQALKKIVLFKRIMNTSSIMNGLLALVDYANTRQIFALLTTVSVLSSLAFQRLENVFYTNYQRHAKDV